MKRINQVSSPTAVFSFDFQNAQMVGLATLAIDQSGYFAAQWWVTGVVSSGQVRLLTEGQCSLPGVDLEYAVAELEGLADYILRIARLSASANGLNATEETSTPAFRGELAKFHIRELTNSGLIPRPGSELSYRTARQYEICKSLGVTNLVELIADYEMVPVSTIRRRIAKSRDIGLIPKTRTLTTDGRKDS
jgi:hypothetical protein